MRWKRATREGRSGGWVLPLVVTAAGALAIAGSLFGWVAVKSGSASRSIGGLSLTAGRVALAAGVVMVVAGLVALAVRGPRARTAMALVTVVAGIAVSSILLSQVATGSLAGRLAHAGGHHRGSTVSAQAPAGSNGAAPTGKTGKGGHRHRGGAGSSSDGPGVFVSLAGAILGAGAGIAWLARSGSVPVQPAEPTAPEPVEPDGTGRDPSRSEQLEPQDAAA